MYMNDQQHEQYDRSSKEIEEIKTTLKTMPDSVKLSVGSHLESRVEALNKEIQTLIDDTHKVSLLLLLSIIIIIIITIIILIRYQH